MGRSIVFLLLLATFLAWSPATEAQSRVRRQRQSANPNNGNGREIDGGFVPPRKQPKTNGAGAVKLGSDPFEDETVALVEDELIVKFKPGTTPENRGKALGKGNGAEKRKLKVGAADTDDLVLVSVKNNKGNKPSREGLKSAAANIKNDPNVEYAEPNFIYKKSQATNDPYYNNLWGMLAGTAGANAVGAWAAGHKTCDGVVIGVIDTGIQIEHPDLKDIIWKNPGEINGTVNRDDEGNGYIDDVNGWDFYSGNPSVYDDPTNDDHGTHVAGTIGATANNGVGVVGVCQSGVKIISAKFLGADGGTTSGAILALQYLRDLKTRYNLNMVATSNSWGGGGYTQALYDEIKRHQDAGILFIAAAGNEGINMDATASYPAGYNLDNIISVGSIDSNGAISSFSNIGATTVDIFAPGGSIISTVPDNNYATFSGTSMATPHVTGAAALYAANHKRLTGTWPIMSVIKASVMNTGTASSTYTGKCMSGKRLNVANLLAAIPTIASPSPAPAIPSPSPAVPPPGPVASPSPASPSPAPAIPSPSPAPAVPSPAPAVPSPAPAVPSPSPQITKRMRAMLINSVTNVTSGFYCTVTIYASDAVTGAAIPGITVSGTVSVSPDIDWWSDWYSQMPYNVYGSLGTYTSGYVESPWIPSRAYMRRYYWSSYSGTRCTFVLNSVTHPEYVLDRSISIMSVTSALL